MKLTNSKTQYTAEGIIYTPAKYSRKPNALDWFVWYDGNGKMLYGSTKDFQTKENFLVRKCGKKKNEAKWYVESVLIDKNYTGSEMLQLKKDNDANL